MAMLNSYVKIREGKSYPPVVQTWLAEKSYRWKNPATFDVSEGIYNEFPMSIAMFNSNRIRFHCLLSTGWGPRSIAFSWDMAVAEFYGLYVYGRYNELVTVGYTIFKKDGSAHFQSARIDDDTRKGRDIHSPYFCGPRHLCQNVLPMCFRVAPSMQGFSVTNMQYAIGWHCPRWLRHLFSSLVVKKILSPKNFCWTHIPLTFSTLWWPKCPVPEEGI